MTNGEEKDKKTSSPKGQKKTPSSPKGAKKVPEELEKTVPPDETGEVPAGEVPEGYYIKVEPPVPLQGEPAEFSIVDDMGNVLGGHVPDDYDEDKGVNWWVNGRVIGIGDGPKEPEVQYSFRKAVVGEYDVRAEWVDMAGTERSAETTFQVVSSRPLIEVIVGIPHSVFEGGEVPIRTTLSGAPKPEAKYEVVDITVDDKSVPIADPEIGVTNAIVDAEYFPDAVSAGEHYVEVTVSDKESQEEYVGENSYVTRYPVSVGDLGVSLKRTLSQRTRDMALWVVIRHSTDEMSFRNYKDFIDGVMCCTTDLPQDAPKDLRLRLPFPGVNAYALLKVATEIFVMEHCGVVVDLDPSGFDFAQIDDLEESIRSNSIEGESFDELWAKYLEQVNGLKTIPYLALIRDKLAGVPIKHENGAAQQDLANCYGILERKLTNPCLIELIWSYWHEEGMLVQAMNAVAMRFQNKRILAKGDPMERLNVDPLRRLSNLIWGHIQDTQHRLDIPRRTYEYDHHYGLRLYGKAVPSLRAVDSRSKFLEAFHNLLYLCSVFFRDDDDTTVIADAYPVLNALKEVHLLLAQGAHNQYGDLPSTARMEMMMQQWILARPEMREFLGGRIMVPYPELWMDRVDNVKQMYDWTDVTVTHFHYLAVFGERILLSVRFGNWIMANDRTQAVNWARYWRSEIQGYMHNYRAVTGVDLTTEPRTGRVDSTMPSVHLKNRLVAQQKR